MHVTNLTADYNKIASSNYTDMLTDYDNCTNNENNIDINIPSVLLTVPCGLSFLCMLSLMIYTLIKPLFNNK